MTIPGTDEDAVTDEGVIPLGRRVAVAMNLGAFARFACAALLLASAALKGNQLRVDPPLALIGGSRGLHILLVEYELLLAAWLLSGVLSKWCRRSALVTFAGFVGMSIYLAARGATSCGCFGRVSVHPLWTVFIDATALALLWRWMPGSDAHVESAGYWWGCTPLALGYLGSGVLLVAIAFPPWALALPANHAADDPATLAPGSLYVLEPDKWIGKRLPVLEQVDIGQQLKQGSWLLVLVHYDCETCREVIPEYEELARHFVETRSATRVAIIDIPPYEPHAAPQESACANGRLTDRLTWFVVTPAEIRLTDGQVVAVRSGEELSATTVRSIPADQ